MGDMDEGEDLAESASEMVPASRARPNSRKGVLVALGRRAAVETLLATGYQPRHCAAEIMRHFGVSETQAGRDVAEVLAQLHADGTAEPQESKRARIIAMLHAQIRGALENKRVWERDGETVEYAEPKFEAATNAIKTLLIVEGLVKP